LACSAQTHDHSAIFRPLRVPCKTKPRKWHSISPVSPLRLGFLWYSCIRTRMGEPAGRERGKVSGGFYPRARGDRRPSGSGGVRRIALEPRGRGAFIAISSAMSIISPPWVKFFPLALFTWKSLATFPSTYALLLIWLLKYYFDEPAGRDRP